MRIKRCASLAAAGALAIGAGAATLPALGQDHAGHDHSAGSSPSAGRRITMEALHAAGGVPPGWRFTLPPGDPAAGRQAFVDLKCYACHAMQGEQFPLKPGETATAGPELTGMGAHHPTEYLVESILNPNAVLVEGPGFIGGDGRSIMPAYADITAAQLVNLIAYLKATSAGSSRHAHDDVREQTAAGYRVRLVYRPPATGEHGQHQHAAGAPPARGRLQVFVTDAASGQIVPYLPVSARIESGGKTAPPVKLAPAIGADGFHYGADLVLPENTGKVTLAIGPASLARQSGAPAQLGRAQTVAFEWK